MNFFFLAIIFAILILLIILIGQFKLYSSLKSGYRQSFAKLLECEEKLTAKTTLLNHISHEIRSPIHGITSISEYLHEHWDDIQDLERKKYLGSISKSSQRLTTLTTELLDLSKFSGNKIVFNFAITDLVQAISDQVQQCQELNAFNPDIKIAFIDNNIKQALIHGDRLRIDQLLSNLFSNSIKYTKEGTIIASLDKVNIDNTLYWQFTLADSGIGIPESELESIFDAFTRSSRTDKAIVGSGLGLSICREIVVAHKGHICAKNNQPKGTKLIFTIPVFER